MCFSASRRITTLDCSFFLGHNIFPCGRSIDTREIAVRYTGILKRSYLIDIPEIPGDGHDIIKFELDLTSQTPASSVGFIILNTKFRSTGHFRAYDTEIKTYQLISNSDISSVLICSILYSC